MMTGVILEVAIITKNQVIPQERQLKVGLEISLEIPIFLGYFIIQKATRDEFRILHAILKQWRWRNLEPLAKFEI